MPYKTKSKNQSLPVGVALGLGTGWLVTLIVSLCLTILIAGERVGETAMAPGAVAAVLLATFVSTAVAAAKVGDRRLPVCLLTGAAYYVSLICCNALFFDGTYQGMIPALLCVLSVSLTVALLGMGKKGRKYKAKKQLKMR